MEATDLSGFFSPPVWSLILSLGVFLGTSLLFQGFPRSSVSKDPACNAGDPGSILGSGGSAGEGIGCPLQCSWASPMAQLVKNLPAVWETWVRSLGWEDPLEKGTATHSSILARRIQNWPGLKESDKTERLSLSLLFQLRLDPATDKTNELCVFTGLRVNLLAWSTDLNQKNSTSEFPRGDTLQDGGQGVSWA